MSTFCSAWTSIIWSSIRRNVLAELRRPNGYLGSTNLSPSRSESGSEADRVKIRSARSRSIGPIEVASRLETCSLPSMLGGEVETSEGEFHAGGEGDCAEVDRGHQTCGDDLDNNPYLARQLSVFVTGNKIYMVGCQITSVMVAQDARKGRRV